MVQTNNHVKPTTKLLWVAFGLGCCCFAWLWGYDNLDCRILPGGYLGVVKVQEGRKLSRAKACLDQGL